MARGWQRRSQRKWRSRARTSGRALGRPQLAWHRFPLTQATDLSFGTPRAELTLYSGAALSPTPAVELAMNNERSAFIERMIVKLAVVIVSTLTAGLIKYWFGIRMQEATDAGVNVAIADAPALNTADTGDRRENWLYRKSLAAVHSGLGPTITPFLDTGGSPQIVLDFKPRRPLPVRKLMIFQHQWGLPAGSYPDGTCNAFLEVETLLRLP